MVQWANAGELKSSGLSRQFSRQTCLAFSLVVVVTVICVSFEIQHQTYSTFLSVWSGRQGDVNSQEGSAVFLRSPSPMSDIALNDGSSKLVSTEWELVLDRGQSIAEYELSYACDNDAVLSSADCTITSVSDSTRVPAGLSVDVTVQCRASHFPGVSSCKLLATDGNREALPSETAQYDVIGFVVYDLDGVDAAGDVTRQTTIFSGENRAYALSTFDTEMQASRKWGLRVYLPGGIRIFQEEVVQILGEATVTQVQTEPLFLYDFEDCQPGNFQRPSSSTDSDVFELVAPETCGVGVSSGGTGKDAVLGVTIRPFKSGSKKLVYKWGKFGRNGKTITYSQFIGVEIAGNAPPVLLNLIEVNEGAFSGKECSGSVEYVQVHAFNLRKAEKKFIRVYLDSGASIEEWPEATSVFTYNLDTDTSISAFWNLGGTGRNVSYQLVGVFGGEERIGITLPSSQVPQSFDFFEAPRIDAIVPPVVPAIGGEVVLSGVFENVDLQFRDSISIGNYKIPATNIVQFNQTHITFMAPPQTVLGRSLSYSVKVSQCLDSTNPVKLLYNIPLTTVIRSLNFGHSDGDPTSFTVPDGSTIVFAVESEPGGFALTYIWSVAGNNGTQIQIPARLSNDRPTFEMPSEILSAGSGPYQVRVTASGFSGMSTSFATLTRLPQNDSFISLLVQAPPPTSRARSRQQGLQIRASTQIFGIPLSTNNSVVYEWSYGGLSVVVDALNTTFNSSSNETKSTLTTGRLGSELRIAPQDLIVGNEEVRITVSLKNNPSLNSTKVLAVVVEQSELSVEINEGRNYTTAYTTNDFSLNAAASYDPDVLDDDPKAGLSFVWSMCRRSADKNFFAELDCPDLLSETQRISSNLILDSAQLSELSISAAEVTYASFGLTVVKEGRTRTVFSAFEIRRTDSSDLGPRIQSVKLLNIKNVEVDSKQVNHLDVLYIRPETESEEDAWRFEMGPGQPDLFKSALVKGQGFFNPAAKYVDRTTLAFSNSTLEPGKSYLVLVSVFSRSSSLSATTEIQFTTAETPRVQYFGPDLRDITTTNDTIVASIRTSFNIPDARFCFSLRDTRTGLTNIVGPGCSSQQDVLFDWPLAGVYVLQCDIVLSTGKVIGRFPEADVESFEIVAVDSADVATRISRTLQTVDLCERMRDFSCVLKMGFVTGQIYREVPTLSRSSATSDRTIILLDRICELIRVSSPESLITLPDALNTVSLARFLLYGDPTLYTEEALVNCAAYTSLIADTALSVSSSPVPDWLLFDDMKTITNRSISIAGSLAHSTSFRSRLVADQDMASPVYDLFLRQLPRYFARIGMQNKGCGFMGELDTSAGDGMDLLPAASIVMSILCSEEDAALLEENSQTSGSIAMDVRICRDILPSQKLSRIPLAFVRTDAVQFCRPATFGGIHTIFTDPVHLEVSAVGMDVLPSECVSFAVATLKTPVLCNGSTSVSNGSGASEPSNTSASLNTMRRRLPLAPWVASGATSSVQQSSVAINIASKVITRSLVGGKVSAGSGFNSSPKTLRLELDESEVAVEFDNERVTFFTGKSGQYLAGFAIDPANPVVGLNPQFWAIAIAAACVLAAVVSATIIFAPWRRFLVAGAPHLPTSGGPEIDRDVAARMNSASQGEFEQAWVIHEEVASSNASTGHDGASVVVEGAVR